MEETNELQKAIDNIQNNNNVMTDAAGAANELEAQIQSQMGVPPVPTMPEMAAPVMPEVAVAPEMAMPEAVAPEVPAQAEASDAFMTPEVAQQVQENPNLEPRAMAEAPVEAPAPAEVTPAEGFFDPSEVPTAEVASESDFVENGEPQKPLEEVGAEAEEQAKKARQEAVAESMMNDIPEISEEAEVAEPEPEVSESAPEPIDKTENLDSVKGSIARDLYGLLDVVEAEPEEKFKVIREMMEETGDHSLIVKGYDVAKKIGDEKAKAEALLYLFENA